MSPETFSITKTARGGKLRDLTALDAAVLARCRSWVITSPNASWIPKPFLGKEDVQMRADGRYGCVDPYQWPQLFSHKYPWSVAIPSQKYSANPSSMSWAWYTPRYSDFVLQNSGSVVGRLNKDTESGLKGLIEVIKGRSTSFRRTYCATDEHQKVDGVHATLNKIWHVIALSNVSWREMVGLIGDYQRVFLELYAMMDFYELIKSRMLLRTNATDPAPPSQPRWLGAFTRAPLMAEQLFAAGVPVWLLRTEEEILPNIIIKDIVKVWEPTDIVFHHFIEPVGQYAWPFDIVFQGNAGEEAMHSKIREVTYVAKDYGTDDGTETAGRKSQGVVRNSRHSVEGWQPYLKPRPVAPPMQRDLWEVAESIFLPAPLACVTLVMPRIKRLVDNGQLKSQTDGALTFRFPDPGMLSAVQSVDTMRRYFGNWLAIRPAWIQHIVDNPSAPLPTSKAWRAFLVSTPADLTSPRTTASARERAKAFEFFRDFLPHGASGATWAGDDSVAFRTESVKVFKSISPVQARGIIWELHELHFWYDVLAMDQALVPTKWKKAPEDRQARWHEIFPLDSIGGTWNDALPASDIGVFRNHKEQDKFRLLNAFARLLSSWPNAPSHFSMEITPSLGDEKVLGAKMELMSFYIKSFYVRNGRPPICPRLVPVP